MLCLLAISSKSVQVKELTYDLSTKIKVSEEAKCKEYILNLIQ
jgi:hypothetical protein